MQYRCCLLTLNFELKLRALLFLSLAWVSLRFLYSIYHCLVWTFSPWFDLGADCKKNVAMIQIFRTQQSNSLASNKSTTSIHLTFVCEVCKEMTRKGQTHWNSSTLTAIALYIDTFKFIFIGFLFEYFYDITFGEWTSSLFVDGIYMFQHLLVLVLILIWIGTCLMHATKDV